MFDSGTVETDAWQLWSWCDAIFIRVATLHFIKWRRRVSEFVEAYSHVPHHAEVETRHLAVGLRAIAR